LKKGNRDFCTGNKKRNQECKVQKGEKGQAPEKGKAIDRHRSGHAIIDLAMNRASGQKLWEKNSLAETGGVKKTSDTGGKTGMPREQSILEKGILGRIKFGKKIRQKRNRLGKSTREHYSITQKSPRNQSRCNIKKTLKKGT